LAVAGCSRSVLKTSLTLPARGTQRGAHRRARPRHLQHRGRATDLVLADPL